LLADLGFDVNVIALTAPLHRAALNGFSTAVKKLIQLGADPTTPDSMYDATPQGWAEHNKQQEVVDYLAGL
jgi:ankyrin repeat protein